MKNVPLVFAIVIGCAHAPATVTSQLQSPPPAPKRDTQHVEATVACLNHDDDDVVRGLVIEKGPNGQPAIHVALFKKLQDNDGGKLTFDMKALAKLKGELSGSSQKSDYSMSVNDSENTVAPTVYLVGIWRRIKTLDESLAYADLVGTSWSCDLDFNSDNAPSYSSWNGFDYWPGERVESGECVHGKKSVRADLYTGAADAFTLCKPDPDDAERASMQGRAPYRPSQCLATDVDTFHRESGDERLAAFKEWAKSHDAKLSSCDPTGGALPAFHTQLLQSDRRVGRVLQWINVFTPSTNPLYPGTDYFNMWRWSNTSGNENQEVQGALETVKTAFQINWLVVQQKAKSGAPW